MQETEFQAMLAEILEIDSGSLSLDSSLEELGWDSLSALTLISEVDTRLSVALDASTLVDAATPRDLLAAVNSAVDA